MTYFEGHRTLRFTLICRCFEFVKQCFMLNLGARPRFGGQLPSPQCRTAPGMFLLSCHKFHSVMAVYRAGFSVL